MSEMGEKLKKPPQMSHTYGITSTLCLSAQTRELVSISIGIHIYTPTCILIYLSIHYKNIRQIKCKNKLLIPVVNKINNLLNNGI